MSRRRVIGLGVAALVVVGVAVAVVTRSSHESAIRLIRVGAVLSPRTPLFGDTVTARVDFAADTRQIVPGSVRMTGRFAPFRTVAKPLVQRKGTGTTEYVVWTATLRCLNRNCLPKQSEKRVAFRPLHVTYLKRDAESMAEESLDVRWPELIVYSRIDPIEIQASDPRDEPPWRVDLASLLSVSFSRPPRLTAAALYGLGGALLLGAAALVVPLRRRELETEPLLEELEVEIAESPFDHALALLERAPARDETANARRRALEFVAAELGRRGQHTLETSARELAWAEHSPSVADASALVRRVRDAAPTRTAE